MQFEWDPIKSLSNQKKHGMNFGKAAEVFSDPNFILFFENRYGNEERWSAIGFTNDLNLLVVIHMYPYDFASDLVRIISARPATKTERRRYAAENG
jgi:uncharacterized protein